VTRYLCVVFSDCKDPAREPEFNDWYDNVHLPDMLEVPGMLGATRWMSADGKENEVRKYLALYELETDDLAKFNDGIRERAMWTMEQGRFSDLPVFDPPNVPRMYVQILEEKRPSSAKG
jgi:hypothetical protein